MRTTYTIDILSVIEVFESILKDKKDIMIIAGYIDLEIVCIDFTVIKS